MSFWKNYFAAHAGEYRRFRPTYPLRLFEVLAGWSPALRLAWDCGTGNGQAALALAERFERVVATDRSPEQIAQATPHPRIDYRCAPAEGCGLADSSVDLVTVAQAAHWFDLERFYAEVRRVARPRAVIALWCYTLPQIDPAIDSLIERFYVDVVGPYWPRERVHVEREYRDLPFPFEEIALPRLAIETEWNLAELLGYVDTWSPVRIFREQRRADPLDELVDPVTRAWGEPTRVRWVCFPLRFRVGRVA